MHTLEKPCIRTDKTLNSYGYGRLDPDQECNEGHHLHHRYIYAKHHGVNIYPNEFVMHLCDNRWCVEVTHLQLGTHADNMQDMVDKNRQASGENNGAAKLSQNDIIEIQDLWNLGYTAREIAKEYSVHYSTIARIANGKLWAKV